MLKLFDFSSVMPTSAWTVRMWTVRFGGWGSRVDGSLTGRPMSVVMVVVTSSRIWVWSFEAHECVDGSFHNFNLGLVWHIGHTIEFMKKIVLIIFLMNVLLTLSLFTYSLYLDLNVIYITVAFRDHLDLLCHFSLISLVLLYSFLMLSFKD